jgi:NAD(P)H dehydrogenase (quinone)
MKPKILVVYCHPNPTSFTHAVYRQVLAGLHASDCDVDALDLYAEGFDPVLVVNEHYRRRDLDKVAYTLRHRERIASCDAMVFVYPVWWGGFPALLKGFIDRTFVSGLTYTFHDRPKTALFPTGLMRGKDAHFFYTLDSPWLFAFVDPGWLANYFTVFSYCGFSAVRRYYLARLKLTSQETRERWLDAVRLRATTIGTKLRARAGSFRMTWPAFARPSTRRALVVLYGGGSKPARRARATLYASVARQLCYRGIRRVRPLAGGLHAWRLRGYPVKPLGTRIAGDLSSGASLR